MRILHYLSYPGYGGSERYALNIATEAKKSGEEVLFILDSEGPLTEALTIRKIKFELLKSNVGFMPLRYLLGFVRSFRIVKNFSPEIIHTHFMRENVIACALRLVGSRAKIIRTVHRLDTFDNFPHRLTLGFVSLFTEKFVAPSQHAAQTMIEKGYPGSKISVIYNGAEELKVKSSQKKVVGMLTRLESGKGALEFLQSLPQDFDDFEMVIAGDGDLRDEMAELLVAKNLKSIKLLGRIDDLEQFFSGVTLLLHPSLNESTLPMSVIEALSAGKEALVFDIPPISEFIGPGLIKIEPGDWQGIRDAAKHQLQRADFTVDDIRVYYRSQFSREALWNRMRELYRT